MGKEEITGQNNRDYDRVRVLQGWLTLETALHSTFFEFGF